MASILTTIGYQAVAIVYVIFSGFVVVRGARTAVARFFLAALVSTAIWAQLFVAGLNGLVPPQAFNLGGVLRDGAWLSFSLALLYPLTADRTYWRTAAGVAATLIFSQFLIYSIPLSFGTVAGVSIDITLVRVCTTILSFVLIENILRNASQADFWALKHWAIGLGAMLLFQLVIRVPEFLTHIADPSIALASPLVFLIALPFFVISSTRLPQLQLRIHSSRTFVFHTATLIAVGILLQGIALTAWYVRSYGGTDSTALALTVAFSGIVAVAAAFVSGTVRSRVRLLINEYFFSFRYDYRLEWEKAIRGLTTNPEKNIAERALRIVCDLMDTSGGAIWLYRESWRQFIPSGKLSASVHVAALREDDERIQRLRREDRPLVEFSGKGNVDDNFEDFRTFIDDGWMVVPLRYRSALAGFVILNKPRAARKLDWEDENLLRVLAMQLAAFLVQEETAQSLADARQLEDFNKRFAFVVHDIKNTIGQLSLLVRNIAQFGDQKEFRDDMVVTLGNSVDRLKVLLKSLTIVGAQNSPGPNVNEVVDLKVFLYDFVLAKTRLGQPVALHMPAGEVLAKTDSIALSRVLEHVVSNALEASAPGVPVSIDLSEAGGVLEIVVADRGAGMTQQFINEELFRPLRSTKRDGFGVGGYQIRELMHDLGGDVAVESAVGSGTRVILSLPMHTARALS